MVRMLLAIVNYIGTWLEIYSCFLNVTGINPADMWLQQKETTCYMYIKRAAIDLQLIVN